ncbi:hypothetical protein OHD16_11810 [Sphingobacterium sp. ML3W]|uniref:hypothetical protein n=1 Tax=Sphingobacterium sp. ML3W TaxID=1538644 RepID=UPI00249B33D9|nr:hypothetical protein [Sphingobacterium sp. ML3W]WFA80645.1 hypothetical protein OGI71_04955 [Sphingobacterium sp. ML3W]
MFVWIVGQIDYGFNLMSNYVKIAFRSLIRTKGFTAINIIGQAAAMLITLWVDS